MRSRLCTTLVLMVLVPLADAHRDVASQQITVSATDLLDYYEAGEFDAVQDALRRAAKGDLGIVLDALKRDGRTWIDADGPQWRPRRRLMAATLALETAHASLDRGWLASRALIEWGASELAKAPPTVEERTWHQAALALCEGALDTISIEAQLKRMERRVPGEPRILLGRAFLEEIREWGKKIVLVINKADILETPDDLATVEQFVRRSALTLLGVEPMVFAVSARAAFRAKTAAGPSTC